MSEEKKVAPEHFRITLKDKPNLQEAYLDNPDQFKEVISTFVQLMEESFDPDKGIKWVELPEKFGCSFPDLVNGILRGSLDLKGIDPDAYDAIKEELHPLAMLVPKRNLLEPNKLRIYPWREHFKLPQGTPINEETVQEIFRKMIRYTRYINFSQLYEHMSANEIAAYRGLGDVQIEKLPFTPALRMQQKEFGDLHVGKMFSDIGAFDLGSWELENEEGSCPACKLEEVEDVGIYKVCFRCNAGFKVE